MTDRTVEFNRILRQGAGSDDLVPLGSAAAPVELEPERVAALDEALGVFGVGVGVLHLLPNHRARHHLVAQWARGREDSVIRQPMLTRMRDQGRPSLQELVGSHDEPTSPIPPCPAADPPPAEAFDRAWAQELIQALRRKVE